MNKLLFFILISSISFGQSLNIGATNTGASTKFGIYKKYFATELIYDVAINRSKKVEFNQEGTATYATELKYKHRVSFPLMVGYQFKKVNVYAGAYYDFNNISICSNVTYQINRNYNVSFNYLHNRKLFILSFGWRLY